MLELAKTESEETEIELIPILRWEDDGGLIIQSVESSALQSEYDSGSRIIKALCRETLEISMSRNID